MKTFYIPLCFYERSPEDDELVILITQKDLSPGHIESRLTDITDRFSVNRDKYASVDDMADAIFDALAAETGGVWSRNDTVERLLIGDPVREENYIEDREMQEIDPAELAALLIKLEPGESLDFYESYDEDSGETEGAYGAAMVSSFDAHVIYINYYGGGVPYINDVSTYDTDLKRQAETLRDYFGYIGNSVETVFVDANRFEELMNRG